MTETCETCRFWVPLYCKCRRRAPVCFRRWQGDRDEWAQPNVMSNEWCGEYEPKPKESP